MKRRWLSAMIAFLVIVVVGCNKEEPKPDPEEPSQSEEPAENLYPELPEGSKEVPIEFFKGKYAPMPLPSTLKVIRDKGFYGCLNKILVIPEGVERIGDKAFAKGHYIRFHFSGYVSINELIGNVEWIYLPKTVKELGKDCLVGQRDEDNGDYSYYNYPNVVMSSVYPPDGSENAFNCTAYFREQLLFVPESGIDNYKWLEDKWALKILSYRPVDVEIFGGDKASGYQFSYQPTAENVGDIVNVRWAVSDESITKIDSATGVLKPKKVGKTYVQCIVGTLSSDNRVLEFYFFKPVEVTADMLTY